jgi:hypothetical protein
MLVVFLMIAILTGVRWNLVWFWFAFPLWSEMVSIFTCVFWPFEFLHLKKFYLVQLPISLLVHWFWESLVFWATCIFWLSVLCFIAGKYFLPVCGSSLQFRDHFFCCAEAFWFYVVLFVHLFAYLQSCWVLLRKSLPIPIASRVFSVLCYTDFRVSGLILRSLIHFELILVQGDKHESSF